MQNPRRKRQLPPPPHVSMAKKAGGAQGGAIASATNFFDRSLHSIGDVLHRTMTFLADPTSPPAALIRGEVISFLCDILDVDTEMRLADSRLKRFKFEGLPLMEFIFPSNDPRRLVKSFAFC